MSDPQFTRHWTQQCLDCGQRFNSRERMGACPHNPRPADYAVIYDRLEEKMRTNCRCTSVYPKLVGGGEWIHNCAAKEAAE